MYYPIFKEKLLMKFFSRILVLFLFFCLFSEPAKAQTKSQIIEDYRAKGVEAQKEGLYDDAFAYYQKALSLDLERAEIYNDLGVLCEMMGNFYEARNYYLDALRVDKNYLATYFNLAFYYKRQGDLAKAAQYFKERVERSHPEDPWVQRSLEELKAFIPIFPDLKRWMQEYEASFLAYRASVLDKQLKAQEERINAENLKQSEFCVQQAKLYEEQQMYEQALAEYDKALSRTPDSPRIIEYRRLAAMKLKERDMKKLMDSALEKFQAGQTGSSKEDIRQILTIIPDEEIKR